MISRRGFIAGACSTASAAAAPNLGRPGAAAPAMDLKSITTGVPAISAEERLRRTAQVQALMTRQKLGALLV
jgi:hypothetical protein